MKDAEKLETIFAHLSNAQMILIPTYCEDYARQGHYESAARDPRGRSRGGRVK